jgi:UDP-2,3-diacylglucosamine pyrophosphatase LpxH
VCFEDLELSQQEEVIKDKSKEFLQNLAIKMASTLWQLGDALELWNKDIESRANQIIEKRDSIILFRRGE